MTTLVNQLKTSWTEFLWDTKWAGPKSMVCWLRIRRDISAMEVPAVEWGVPAPSLHLQSRARKRRPRKTKGCGRWRHAALKGPAHKLAHSRLQHRGSSSKSTQDIWGGIKLTNFRAKPREAGFGATLFRDRRASRHHCFFVDLSSQPSRASTEST